MEDQNHIKVVLLGEVGVGKTSIIKQFAFNQFDNESILSTYATFVSKKMEFKDSGIITFDIWDTAGQEKYRSITSVFYKNAKIIILVYDITNKKSFDEIQNYWYEQIKMIYMRSKLSKIRLGKYLHKILELFFNQLLRCQMNV